MWTAPTKLTGPRWSLGWQLAQLRLRASLMGLGVVLLLANLVWTGSALAAPPASSGAPPPAAEKRAGLPRLPKRVLPKATDATKGELEEALSLCGSNKASERKEGHKRLFDGASDLLPAMASRLRYLRKHADRKDLKKRIRKARKAGRKLIRRRKRARKEGEELEPIPFEKDGGDWLYFVQLDPKGGEKGYRHLVEVLEMERALVHLGSVPATRELIHIYKYFGKVFRIDVQHMIERLGTKAVPVLIESQRGDSEKVAQFAARQLDVLGKAAPGEAVQTGDNEQLLADVLKAFGYAKQMDALRVVISMTSHEHRLVRHAARAALVHYGAASRWRLRDAIEDVSGKKPPRSMSWKALCGELFRIHDEARMAAVLSMLRKGQEYQKAGKLEEMAKAYDNVLARQPEIEGRDEMARGYRALARKIDAKEPARALALARKALWLDPKVADRKKLRSYIFTLVGELHEKQGLADGVAYKRAILLNENNGRAQTNLAKLERAPAEKRKPKAKRRYYAAVAIGGVAFLAVAALGLIRRPTYAEARKADEVAEIDAQIAAQPVALGPETPAESPPGTLTHTQTADADAPPDTVGKPSAAAVGKERAAPADAVDEPAPMTQVSAEEVVEPAPLSERQRADTVKDPAPPFAPPAPAPPAEPDTPVEGPSGSQVEEAAEPSPETAPTAPDEPKTAEAPFVPPPLGFDEPEPGPSLANPFPDKKS